MQTLPLTIDRAQLWLGSDSPDDSDLAPLEVSLPDYWPVARRAKSHQGWYRMSVELGEHAEQLALLLPNLSGRALVLWDGQVLGQTIPLTGVGAPVVAGPLLLTIPGQLSQQGRHELTVQFVGRISQLGFLRQPMVMAQSQALALYSKKMVSLVYLPIALCVASLVVAMIFFAAYVGGADSRGFGWLALGLAMSALSVLGLYISFPEQGSFLVSRLRPSLFHYSFVCFLLAILQIQKRPIGLWPKLVVGISSGVFTLMFVVPELHVNQVSAGWILMSYGIGIYLFVQLCKLALFPPRRWAGLIPIVFVPLFIAHDWLGVLNKGNFWADQMLGIYNSALFGFALMIMLVLRAKQNAGELVLLNQELEARVLAKHTELEENFDRMAKVERQAAMLSERERMVREMHDGLGGQLVSTLAMVESGRFSEAEIEAALRDSLDDLRMMVNSLDQDESELADLLALVRERTEPRLSRQGINLHWHLQDLPAIKLAPEQAGHILRVVQESLTNILKHASARNIWVRVVADAELEYQIEIADDGCGVAVSENQAQGRGLGNMKTRAQQLGGRLDVCAVATGGTRVCLQVPRRRSV